MLYFMCEVARPHLEGLAARHRDLRLRRRSPAWDVAPLVQDDAAGVFRLIALSLITLASDVLILVCLFYIILILRDVASLLRFQFHGAPPVPLSYDA